LPIRGGTLNQKTNVVEARISRLRDKIDKGFDKKLMNCNGKRGIIEVKSFIDVSEIRNARLQAAAYADSLGLTSVSLVLFVSVDDETILEKLSSQTILDRVTVHVVAIGWT
jgi:hypothetical protein